MEKCGSCHTLARAGTRARRAEPRRRLPTALADGFDRDTVEGIVHDQILHPRVTA